MADVDRISALTLEAQERMFRLVQRDTGVTLQQISLDSGIPYNTIRSYAGHNGAPSMMPVSAVNKLAGVIPDKYLSHLLFPTCRFIAEANADESDHDGFAGNCISFASIYQRSRHPESEEGVNLSKGESDELLAQRMQMRGKA